MFAFKYCTYTWQICTISEVHEQHEWRHLMATCLLCCRQIDFCLAATEIAGNYYWLFKRPRRNESPTGWTLPPQAGGRGTQKGVEAPTGRTWCPQRKRHTQVERSTQSTHRGSDSFPSTALGKYPFDYMTVWNPYAYEAVQCPYSSMAALWEDNNVHFYIRLVLCNHWERQSCVYTHMSGSLAWLNSCITRLMRYHLWHSPQEADTWPLMTLLASRGWCVATCDAEYSNTQYSNIVIL